MGEGVRIWTSFRFCGQERLWGSCRWSGSRQSFERRKVLGGMIRACEKRPVSLAELEEISERIEQTLQNSMEREISTEVIGERVMEELRKVDQVAYVRFASVYRQFKDIDTFMAELSKLLAEK